MKYIYFFLILLSSVSINAVKLYEFDNIYKPKMIAIDGDYIYISTQSSVMQYSLKEYKLIKRFGRKGQGPGEFNKSPVFQIVPESDEILLYERTRLTIFNKKGTIIFEKNHNTIIAQALKLADNFIIEEWNMFADNEKVSINVLDKNFKKINSIVLKNQGKKGKKGYVTLLLPRLIMKCSKNKLILSNQSKGINLEIYDSNGKKLKNIAIDYKNITISAEEKEKIKNECLDSPGLKKYRKGLKDKLLVAQEYPAIKDIFIDNNLIYLNTYKIKSGKQEFIVVDFNGKNVNKIFLPINNDSVFLLNSRLDTIYNQKYYYLKENENNETYELFCEKLEKLKI